MKKKNKTLKLKKQRISCPYQHPVDKELFRLSILARKLSDQDVKDMFAPVMGYDDSQKYHGLSMTLDGKSFFVSDIVRILKETIRECRRNYYMTLFSNLRPSSMKYFK